MYIYVNICICMNMELYVWILCLRTHLTLLFFSVSGLVSKRCARLVIGIIPVLDQKNAVRAGRPEDGPKSAASRLICVTHQVCADSDRDYLQLLSRSNKNQIVVKKHCSGWKQAPLPLVPRTCCLWCSTVTHAGKIASCNGSCSRWWHQHHSMKHAWQQQCFGECSLELPVLINTCTMIRPLDWPKPVDECTLKR